MPFKSTIHNPQFTICIEVIEMDAIETLPTQQLDPFKGVKKVPLEEYFTSGHRTCQGCESALVMKLMVKAAGPRTIVLGSTGCMYVANTTYYSTSWVVPWMHTQWTKTMAGMLAAGHPETKYVGTVCASYAVDMMNRVRKALMIGGPTFVHSLDPCPKGWDYDPMLSHELGELAVETGIWPLYEGGNRVLELYGRTKGIAEKRSKRKPGRDSLLRQGRFAHFTDDDIDYFQAKIANIRGKWLIPGAIPFWKELEKDQPPA